MTARAAPATAGSDETTLMHAIMTALPGPPDGVWWRQNVGVGVAPGQRVIRFGVPGMADIGGVYRGRHIEIEVKTDTGRQSEQQRRWERAVTRAGGVYVLARSIDDALAALARLDALVAATDRGAE